ncbi:hypothetical protein L596_012438 [Steinernema carpocapsae]|uniref:Uncharacterized protein n=1 Tax=Steinernema carpocapsae TaxID=34508 RepID=A0A4U5NXF3_STECR|nr:hypothetical protein L596_012438 [Steinernema carpocapsae]
MSGKSLFAVIGPLSFKCRFLVTCDPFCSLTDLWVIHRCYDNTHEYFLFVLDPCMDLCWTHAVLMSSGQQK